MPACNQPIIVEAYFGEWAIVGLNLPRSGLVQQAPRVDRPPPSSQLRRRRVHACHSGAALAGPMVTGTFHSGKMETEVLSSNF